MYNFYYITAFFLLYGFLGWCLEVAYHVVSVGKVINRGFLNGPICPIYGIGMVGILTILEPFSQNLIFLYIGGLLFATVVELIGGFVLYKAFHLRWWDYSNEPFNLGGFVCVKFSLAWGFCICVAVKVIHPVVKLNVKILDNFIGHALLIFFCIYLLVDFVCTVLSIMNLNKDLKKLNSIAAEMRKTSNELTERIGKRTLDMEIKVQEGRVQAALAKAEGKDRIEELREEFKDRKTELRTAYETRVNSHPDLHRLFGYERLRKAYPNLRHGLYDDELQTMMEGFKSGKDKMIKLLEEKIEKKYE